MGRMRGILLGILAAGGGVGLAVALGASAGAAGPTTTTLGSTTGSPSMNICSGGINCTYVPFDPVSQPELQVPYDGTVTSFSVNSGSATGNVKLRVLRPAGNGQFTGAGTSPAEALSGGGNTYVLSPALPVRAGDVLALDNDSSALMFDNTSQTAVTGYYQLPALADGQTAAPNNRRDLRLLLSAVVQANPTTTTTTTTATTSTSVGTNGTTTVVVTTPGPPPVLTKARQARRKWTKAKGTTFSFTLSERALVSLTFRKRGRASGSVAILAHPGLNRLPFNGVLSNGKSLPLGRYTVTLLALTEGGQSTPAKLTFTIKG